MRDHLNDLIQHTSSLGFIDLIKVIGTDKETAIHALAEDNSVILYGKFKTPLVDFIGTFGMPNLSKLKIILGFDDYDENSLISIVKENNTGNPVAIHFETASKDFTNDYRLMSKDVVEAKLRPITFAGATWHVQFEPKVLNIQRLKKQSQVHNDQMTFSTKTENGNLKIYFGMPSSHHSNFIFESGIKGALQREFNWPVRQFLSVLDLPGDKMVYISDKGAMRITVDSGIADYEYLLPAQT